MFKFLEKLKLKYRPPQKGETYVGDAFYQIIGSQVKKILHGLVDKEGNLKFEVMYGEGTYKLLIVDDEDEEYACSVATLVRDSTGIHWHEATLLRRISKEEFRSMILQESITKELPCVLLC